MMIALGFNYSQTHDSSACTTRDGGLLFAVAKERISRVKHDAGFPHDTICACLKFANVRPDQLDIIMEPVRVYSCASSTFRVAREEVDFLRSNRMASLLGSFARGSD